MNTYPEIVRKPGSEFALLKFKPKKNSSKPTSEVWEHYRLDADQNRHCVACLTSGLDPVIFSAKTSVTNMKTHLKSLHDIHIKDAFIQKLQPTNLKQIPIDTMVKSFYY